MVSPTAKIIFAMLMIIGGIWAVVLAYKYDQKFQHEGFTPLKAAFYTGGIVIVLIGLAGLNAKYFRTNNFLGWLITNDLFQAIARFAT